MRSILFKIIFLSFLVLSSQVFAQNKDLIINGDEVSYDKENNLVEGRASVEVIYKNVRVHGNHVVYNTESERVSADDNFYLQYNGVSIEGETLDYAIKEKRGKASNVEFVYKGMKMRGGFIELGREKLHFKDALFTTCDLDHPHYRVTARDINFHPEYGWLVAYWGFFWLGPLPLVPMPTYIYDMRAEERDEKNLPPFPEIGSNDDDGSYINQRLAWHIRRELSGTYSINYAAKKGVGGGAEADYVVNENSRGQIRFYGNGNDGLWGGITHRLFFGREVIQDKAGVFSFFALPQYKQYELETVLSHRERVNYQRVSFSPGLVLKRKQGEIIRKEAKYDAEFMLGQVNEENNLNLRRGGGAFSFYWDFPEVVVGKVTPSAALDARFYSNGQRWVKTMGGMDVRKALGKNISLGLGYLHYFGVDGQTPFNFEKHRYGPADYRFIAADRLTSDLYFVLGETGVKIETAYLLHTWQPEDIDYSLFFKLHCYNLMVKYRSLQREFEMGFSLAGG